MTGVLLALGAAYGVFLLYTALVFGWRGIGFGPAVRSEVRRRDRFREWLVVAGLEDVRPIELAAVTAVFVVVGAGIAYAIFGGIVAPALGGAFAGTFPIAAARARHERRLGQAREAWPRLIEEVRLQTTSMGRSIPQALFAVGQRAPLEMRPAFDAAHREWLIWTDFERACTVLKARLADATADVVCETLLIAHEVGGSDVGPRLAALVEDRIQDVQGRKDAQAKQAGARFARRFVLIVPLGMALAGLSIGNGRAAYESSLGQVGVAVAIGLIVVCWMWAGRFMQLPREQRVFYSE